VTTQAVLIAGGGPVGSVLALALSGSGVACTLVDRAPVDTTVADFGRRPIALSASSARILNTLQVWESIASQACPIQIVHVGEAGRFGAVRLRAQEHGVPALGYVTDASVITTALDHAVANAQLISNVRSAQVLDAHIETHQVCAVVDGPVDAQVRAQLLVAADGGRSSLCEQIGIDVVRRNYRQSELVCNITPDNAHQGIAYERFTRTGPLALLPLANADCALIWTLPEAQAQQIAALDEDEFLMALQGAFGQRLGRLRRATPRSLFPLSLVRAQQLSSARVTLIGNAANQLHPVAGQGLNLGLRDAAVLAELVVQAARAGRDAGGAELLANYARRRRAEHQGIVRFTDALARGFSAGPQWLGWLRSAGMLAIDLTPGANHLLASHAMGLGGVQPRLVRGLAA
jgi:2-octaprenyl-6-methoxyphenol hydroxylase